MKVIPISLISFKKRYKIADLNPWISDVFTLRDLKEIQEEMGVVNIRRKIGELIRQFPIFIKEPIRIIFNLKAHISEQTTRISTFYKSKSGNKFDTFPFYDYSLRASIAAAFKPKRLLEIGTSNGWGTTAFKSVLRKCECITLNPKSPTETIGKVFRNKKLGIKQIWADSLTFNFSKLGKVDFTYIDGNHEFKWVYSDLVNSAKITRKVVMLDDYIPSKNSPRGNVTRYLYFNKYVVGAVDAFLRKYPKVFKKAYWLKNTNLCILIK